MTWDETCGPQESESRQGRSIFIPLTEVVSKPVQIELWLDHVAIDELTHAAAAFVVEFPLHRVQRGNARPSSSPRDLGD
jgi:hypothetical protein